MFEDLLDRLGDAFYWLYHGAIQGSFWFYGALGNIVHSPEIAIQRNALNQQYQTYVERTLVATNPQLLNETSFIGNIANTPPTKFPNINSIDRNERNCSKICPDDFRIFNWTREQSTPEIANQLSFMNHGTENPPDAFGYCWGHANLTFKFNQIAIFEPNLKKLKPKIYREVFERIRNNWAQSIPGYKNLFELSEDPAIKKYLVQFIRKEWQEHASKRKAYQLGNIDYYVEGQKSALIEVLYFHLKYLQVPVLLTKRKTEENFKETHVVVAYDILSLNEEDSLFKICVKDNNFPSIEQEKCHFHFEVDLKHPLRPDLYFEYHELSGKYGDSPYKSHKVVLQIPFHYTTDLAQQIESLGNLCREKTGCID